MLDCVVVLLICWKDVVAAEFSLVSIYEIESAAIVFPTYGTQLLLCSFLLLLLFVSCISDIVIASIFSVEEVS